MLQWKFKRNGEIVMRDAGLQLGFVDSWIRFQKKYGFICMWDKTLWDCYLRFLLQCSSYCAITFYFTIPKKDLKHATRVSYKICKFSSSRFTTSAKLRYEDFFFFRRVQQSSSKKFTHNFFLHRYCFLIIYKLTSMSESQKRHLKQQPFNNVARLRTYYSSSSHFKIIL